MPTINPDSSIPELIKFIRHSFRECQFDEVQSILMKRENSMKDEMENLVRDRESLKKEVDLLENNQSFTELEKCSAEDKLERSRRRGEELDKKIVQMGAKIKKLESEKLDREEKLERSRMRGQELDKVIVKMGAEIEKLESEKLDHEEKLEGSSRKCDESLVKMGKEIEELRRENLCANKAIEELKVKEIETERIVQELKCKNDEALQTINELRSEKMESDKAAASSENSVLDLDLRILKLETVLAKMLGVNVEDLASVLNGMENVVATAATDGVVEENAVEGARKSLENGLRNSGAEDRAVISPEVPAISGDRNLAHSGRKEDDTNMVRTYPSTELASASKSAVAESRATVQNNEGKVAEDSGSHTRVIQSDGEACTEKTVPSSSGAAKVVIEIYDSDDENPSSGQTKKRGRRESGEDSPNTKRKKRSNSAKPSRCISLPSSSSSSRVEERGGVRQSSRAVEYVDSEDESYSDMYMNNLVANLQSKGQKSK